MTTVGRSSIQCLIAVALLLAAVAGLPASASNAQALPRAISASLLQPFGGQDDGEPGGGIRGVVLSRYGHDVAEMRVQLLATSGDVLGTVTTDDNGAFQFDALLERHYRLRVLDQNGRLLVLENEHEAAVHVGPRGTLQIVLRLANQPPSAAPQSMAPDAVQSTVSITGVVTASNTSLPVSGVDVEVDTPDAIYVDNVTTDAQGKYAFQGIPPGDYRIRFNASGVSPDYAREWYSDAPDLSTATVVTVVSGQTSPDINGVLDIGGKISGHVTGADNGLPISGLNIRVYDAVGYVSATATTDASGYYTTTALKSGSYPLRFTKHTTGVPKPYLSEYYNHQLSRTSAAYVSVNAPAVTTGIDTALPRGAQISGTITAAESGLPLPTTEVQLFDCSGFFLSAYPDSNGAFISPGVPSGRYRVRVNSFDNTHAYAVYNNEPVLAAADVISLTAPNSYSNINLALPVGGMITGVVTLNGATPPLYSVFVDAFDPLTGGGGGFAQTQADGSYAITGLSTGSYVVYFSADDYVGEYFDNVMSSNDGALIHIAGADTVRNINADLALGGRITGMVSSALDGTPLSTVRVVAYDANGSSSGSSSTDGNGVFRSQPLTSGSYRLKFYPGSFYWKSNVYGYQFYSNTLSYAAALPVNVSAPLTTTNINASLNLGGFITGTESFPRGMLGGSFYLDRYLWVYNSEGPNVGFGTDTLTGYRTTGLPSGNYRVLFHSNNTLPTCDGPMGDQYYNFKFDYNAADIVSVSAPNTTGGINFNVSVIWKTLLPMLLR